MYSLPLEIDPQKSLRNYMNSVLFHGNSMIRNYTFTANKEEIELTHAFTMGCCLTSSVTSSFGKVYFIFFIIMFYRTTRTMPVPSFFMP